jgi:cellulose synthase/poly-beta-1,6-N-acetylglucosamine synthase-like glycosyltransferase/peptidoglycan/xylan/chitin deacetylase (PgdA/CDA1 family)
VSLLGRGRLPVPPFHRVLLGSGMVLVLAMLMIDGLATHAVGAPGTGHGTVGAAAPLRRAGPFFAAAADGGLRSIGSPPGRRVALTFDDGPGPWTPNILSVLRRDHVPATFFVIGSNAVRYRGLLAREFDEGFTIGNHTFTHVAPASVPGPLARLEVALTNSVVAGVTGREPRLFRPPYSSTPDAVTPADLRAYSALARRGQIVVLATYDSEDWKRPGVDQIIRDATPRGGRGGVIMFHDGGGNRSQTVAALQRLIPRLRARGYRFVSLESLLGVPRGALDVPVGAIRRAQGSMLVDAVVTAAIATEIALVGIAVVGFLTALRMVFVLVAALVQARRRRPSDATFLPPVSIVVPAHNEAAGVGPAVASIAASDYPTFEVLVVDDGSTDGTADVVERLTVPGVRVVRQPNAGKAAALTRGIANAQHHVIVMVDADTLFEPDTLRRLVQPLRDPAVGAVSGNAKVGNRSSLLGRWQHIEYVMGFNLDRRVYELFDCMPTVPGAVGAFRREALAAAGGVSGTTLAEDTDLTLAIGRAGWHVAYAPDARAWTEAPGTLRALWRQRYRWAYGTLQALWRHKSALIRRDPGPAGRRALPYLLAYQIVLPLAAPLVDLFAVFGLVFLDPLAVAAYWLGFTALQLVLAVVAFRLDGERLRPLWTLPLQQLVYRQLMYVVVFEAIVAALRGIRLPWMHNLHTGEVRIGA